MTTLAPAPPAPPAPASAPVRFGRLLVSEWTKLRSVRSTVASLGLLAWGPSASPRCSPG